MSVIQISTLQKINSLVAKISKLESQVAELEQSTVELKARKEMELLSYVGKIEETEIQKQTLEKFTKSQAAVQTQENSHKLKVAHEIEALISTFLEGDQLNNLVTRIIQAHPNQEYVLEADPILAKKFGLDGSVPAKAGVLQVVFDHKKFVLSPEYLAQNLREKLLVSAFN